MMFNFSNLVQAVKNVEKSIDKVIGIPENSASIVDSLPKQTQTQSEPQTPNNNHENENHHVEQTPKQQSQTQPKGKNFFSFFLNFYLFLF